MKCITFGSYVKEAREALCLRQNEAARLIQISPSMLLDTEKDRRFPSLDRVKQFAAVLRLDEDYLCYLLGYWPAPERHGEKLGADEFKRRMEAFRD